MYDPNLIREEAGLSKGPLLSLVMAKRGSVAIPKDRRGY